MDFQKPKNRFERMLRTKGLSEKSIAAYMQACDHLLNWCAEHKADLMSITAPEFERYLSAFAQNHSSSYTRNRRVFLSRFFQYMAARGWIETTPVTPKPHHRSQSSKELSGRPGDMPIDEYCAYLLTKGRSERTATNYAHLLRRLLAYLNKHGLDWRTIKLQDLMRFQSWYRTTRLSHRLGQQRHQKARSITSVALITTATKSFYGWAARMSYVKASPASGLETPERPKTEPRGLQPTTLDRLLQLINNPPESLTLEQREEWSRNRMIVLTLLFTGIRLSECAELTWENVDLEEGTVRIEHRKGDKEQTLPLNRHLRNELRSFRPSTVKGPLFISRKGGRLTNEGISEMFRRFIRDQLGISCTAHQLRHTTATWLINQGAKPEVIQLLLGHEDVKTTMRYARVNDKRVRGLVEQLPAAWCGQKESTPDSEARGMSLESMRLLGGSAAS